MKMSRLAICIPTYNQPGMIREMCIRCLDVYDKFGVDVYIYDSSPGADTEDVVSEYKEKYANIYYRHLADNILSNIKVLEAYKEILAMNRYEFLWLCPDYIQLTLKGTECVLDHCMDGFDVCVINYRDVEHIGEKVYTDINEFFLDCAWHMSSYMATIIYLPSFADMEWEYFYDRYTTPNRVNHSHVALYFEKLAQLPNIKAVHVPISSAHMRVSPYRKDSLWKREVFSVWCEYWPDMIQALPDKYQNKDKVIKKLGVNTGIFSWRNFLKLRKESIYDINIYHKYRKQWRKLTNVPPELLWLAAVIPAWLAELLEQPSLKRMRLKKLLSRFGMKHSFIYIYGCGYMAQKTSVLLDELHVKYCGYVVSDRSSEKENFNGLPVIDCEGLPFDTQDTGIIIALNRENAFQVMRDKHELGSYRLFYIYQYEDVL